MHCRISFFTVVVLLTLAIQPQAQADQPVKSGDRVKVEYDERVTEKLLFVPLLSHNKTRSVSGTLDSLTDDSLFMTSPGAEGNGRFSLDEVKALHISVSRKRAPFRGFLWGAGIGAFVGVLLLSGDPELEERYVDDSLEWIEGDRPNVAEVVGIFAGIGAAVGTIAGYLAKRDRWQRVALNQSKVGAGVEVRRDRILARVSIRF